MIVLKKREKILVGITGGIALMALAYGLLAMTGGSTSTSLTDLRSQREKKQNELTDKRRLIQTAAQNAEKVKLWESQSLPASDAASTAYQTWLRQVLEKVRFHNPTIAALGEKKSPKRVYTAHPYRVNGQAGLEQVTRFLYEFYSAPHLHQIRHLSLKPIESGKSFEVTISVEAIALPTTDRRDKLAEGRAQRLAQAKVEDYLKMIVRRQMEDDRYVEGNGVFMPYSPAPPPVVARRDPPPRMDPPKPPGFDHKKETYVTGIVAGIDGKPEVWIIVRTTGKQYQLAEGGKFEVGDKRGVVRQIGRDDVEVEIDGQRRRVKPGTSFADAKAAEGGPPGKPPAPTASGGSPALGPLAAERASATAAQPSSPTDPLRGPSGRGPSGPFDRSRGSRFGSR